MQPGLHLTCFKLHTHICAAKMDRHIWLDCEKYISFSVAVCDSSLVEDTSRVLQEAHARIEGVNHRF